MNKPAPSITIPVELTNPGQFFSCCGLLELASRLDPGAVAWFDADTFSLSGDVRELLPRFRGASFKQIRLNNGDLRLRNGKIPKDPKTICPVAIAMDCCPTLVLDWWLRPSEHNGLKLWSGSNSVIALVEDVFAAIRSDTSANILKTAIQLARQPFFYAAARPLHEREVGISMDKIGREFEHFPYVELLTLIALQRFRPSAVVPGRFRYCAWGDPISAEIAGATAGGAIPPLVKECFEFPVIDRDNNGHKQFTCSERTLYV